MRRLPPVQWLDFLGFNGSDFHADAALLCLQRLVSLKMTYRAW